MEYEIYDFNRNKSRLVRLYDKSGKISLNEAEDYVTYGYIDQKVNNIKVAEQVIASYTARNAWGSAEKFVTDVDLEGNILNYIYNGAVQYQQTYCGNLLETAKDGLTNICYYYQRDAKDRITAIYPINASGEKIEGMYEETYEYDTYGQLTKKTLQGDVFHEYTYQFKTDSTRKLASISVNGITIIPQTDVLNRATGKKVLVGTNVIEEEKIQYRKVGDHATNMPSAVYYGDKTSGEYLIQDNLKHVYDEMGNISKVYENGELITRYA